MTPAGKVEKLIKPTLDDMGYDIVRVQLMGSKRMTLQIMAERKDLRAMTVDDCTAISREVSAILDVEDPIEGAYSLEVSSPGIDRPLVSLRDFERYAGFEAKVDCQHAIDGRKRFRGTLMGVVDGNVRIRMDGADVDLPFEEIHRAKLLLTDALINAAQQATV